MSKNPTIADFRDKVTLLKATVTVDSELNRIEALEPVATVWAAITAKNSVYDNTEAGTKPITRYEVVLRKSNYDFAYILWGKRVLSLNAPAFDIDNKYTKFEAVLVNGQGYKFTEVS